jgi:hypothetical protein
MYLLNGQTWHRRAPIRSQQTRYLLKLTYGKRWISHYFFPYVNYRIPEHVLARCSSDRQRILGCFRD